MEMELITRITAEYSSEDLDAAKAEYVAAMLAETALRDRLDDAETRTERARVALLAECRDIEAEEKAVRS